MYYVYCYKNPLKNDEIFYIGKGKGNRMYDHLKNVLNNINSKNQNRHKYYTIKNILVSGKLPIIEIMYDNLTEQQAYEYEKQLILQYKSSLTNITNGGTGGDTITNNPNKLIISDKIRKSNTGKSHGDAYKKHMSEMHSGKNNPFFGKHHTDENKYKSGSSMRNKKQTIEHVNAKKTTTEYVIKNNTNNTILIFNSALQLESYFKELCKLWPRSKRISGQILRRSTSYKNYTVISKIRKKLNK